MISVQSITTVRGDYVHEEEAVNSSNFEFDILIRIRYQSGGTLDYVATLMSLETLARSVEFAPCVGRQMIIMKSFDDHLMRELIEDIVARCDSDNADTSTERLGRYFMCEHDKYWI